MTHRHLLTPLALGRLTLRNRVVFSAHLTNSARGGLPTEQHIAYYEARAKGGAGLIITEEHSTHPSDWPYEKLIQGYRPEVIPHYRTLTDTVRAHGSVILAQLNHNGGQGSGMYSRRPVLAPSPVADPLFREVPKALDPAEIAELVAGFATTAEHCRRGGFDGVEIQCSQASIVRAFLSPDTNRRTDRYGGALANRARFLLEIVASVRAALGPEPVLGVRLTGEESIENGIHLDEAVEVAAMVEACGQVDYINTSIGMATQTLHLIEGSMAVPRGYALFIPNAIRKRVTLPVIGVGRFTDPEQADLAIEEGHCDLIGVVRGQIADPDFAAKAAAGRSGEIRTCLSCNQECIGRVGLGRWLGCVENPRAGRESVPLPMPRRFGLRVCVIGGGPAGLQAAATAAQSGHRVTLFERDARTGGQVRVAAGAAGRAEFGELVRNLEAECVRSGVEVMTGVDVDADLLRALAPDAVIVATGARPRRPGWAGESARVVDVRDVLEGRVEPGGRVLVIDELGFHQATSVAESLADRGCVVTVATNGMIVGQDLGLTLDMEGWQRRAHRKGIAQLTDLVPMAVADAPGSAVRVALLHHPTGITSESEFDWVVCAVHQQPEDRLWKQLSGSEFEVHRIGDALTPRRADAAVREGHRVAVAL
ncbi:MULTISPECIES: mycofactocin system FadH/OYE family oxidoreductase 2 [Rhodococcus]|uniref:mycofactocin system FadH/OYE family oxidoreductase 2 n=1 Tax=Rhodococcus TaxID=1827 RepID=UPI000BD9B3F4|nr:MULTISPECIES: mycofactocin system FadH/OYE family oxidoreductase 2 [Rhodococcus]MBP1162673.1 2,4-dienoyl-CoA reductase (NADPH2) [Rhodococcus sp. PvR099]MCZ4555355.1 mycofactocin system FadH/OYE family oxidoreductase 2 [Rhodococcus maanshanensis]PTR44038.1 2,4-dienoyl-CoA reductase (NADPH2) [Rhodococcus sp. OK611]SNX90340.1 2,4-dienoyl-CoA reductase (NADPH2) [Rhodococcus sp. OK270]